MEQPQVRVEDLDQRPPRRLALLDGAALVGEADLGQLEAPVAELAPDRLVQEPRHLAEGVPGDRLVDGGGGRGGARQEPALGGAEVRRSRAGGARRRRRSSAGRAPTTKRVAFHSLLAKFRACSSLASPKRWSLPGVAPWMTAKRSASAPASSMTPERVDDVALRLRHLLAVRVADEPGQVDRVERLDAGQLEPEHHHPGDPEEDDVVAGLHDRGRVVASRGRACRPASRASRTATGRS